MEKGKLRTKDMRCFLCGHNSFETLINMDNFPKLSTYINVKCHPSLKYAFCTRCGLIYQESPPSNAALEAFYKEWRQDINLQEFQKYTESKLRMHREIVDWIHQDHSLSSRRGRMLDIGTADGSLCELFKQRGWQVYGVEQTPKMLEFAKLFYPDINLVAGIYEKKLFPAQYFDLAIFCLCLEHFRNPAEALETCSYHLKDNGYLYIQVPTFMSKNFTEFNSTHFYIFTTDTLSRLLAGAGYKVIKTKNFFSKLTGRRNLCVLCAKDAMTQAVYFPARSKLRVRINFYKATLFYRCTCILIFTPLLKQIKKILRFTDGAK